MWVHRALWRRGAAVGLLSLLVASAEPNRAAGNETEKPTARKEPSIDDIYVRTHLKEYLRADKLEFKDDGRVEVHFDLSKKNQDHERIFMPPVDRKIQSNFRWTTGREEHIAFYGMTGLKVANQGMAALNCWFLDDRLEAEIEYIPRGSFNPRHYFALAFADPKMRKAFGNNMGTQCAFYSRGRQTRRRAGTVEPIASATRTKFKLVVNNGLFEAHKNGRKVQSLEYDRDDFRSGRISFVWGGALAGSVSWLKISGRIDSETMAKFLRKDAER